MTKPQSENLRKLTFRALALRRSDDQELTLETSAFESLYGGQFTLPTQLTKPNYLASCYSPHRRSTTVSLETHPLYSQNLLLLGLFLWSMKIWKSTLSLIAESDASKRLPSCLHLIASVGHLLLWNSHT